MSMRARAGRVSPHLTDVEVEDVGGSAFTEETAEKGGELRTEHVDSI